MRRILVAVAAASSWALVAVGSLAPMLVETTKSLTDPSGKSLYEAWRASKHAAAAKDTSKKPKSKEDPTNRSAESDDKLVDTRISDTGNSSTFLCATPE